MTDTRLEVWDRPGTAGFASRIETLDSIVDSSRLQPVNGIGEGKVSVPDTFTEVDKVLTVDPVTPANSVRSLIRVYLDGDVSGVSTPYREWLPDAAIPPSEAESGRYEITGLGIESIVRDAVVEPWDWNGEPDFASSWPDWIYGGRDLLSPLQTVFKPHIFHVWVVGTGGAISGTLDIGLSFDGAAFENATVAHNATALAVEAAIEAFTFSPDVEVTGFGTEANPWEISVLSPGGVYVSAQSTGALVNAVARGSLKQVGVLLPVGWEPSKLDNTSTPHGFLSDFRASLGVSPDPAVPAGCSAWIVFNGTEPLTPGVQTFPLKVIPGGIYQLPDDMILRAWGAGALVRVVVRDLDENILFDILGNPAFEEINLTADTNTNITGIADIMIPEGVSQIIVRVGHIGTGDPPPISIACPSFIEGFEAATVGYIVRKFYEDWTVDHIADTFPLDYWLHGDGGHYLDLDFSDTLDSAGNAWPRDEKITVRAGSRFDKVLGLIVGLGYEWRVIPAPVDGYWLLQIFAAPTLGTDFSALDTPTIRGGRDVTKRAIRRWLPKTAVMVQGADQFFSHAASAGAQATLGISTDYQPRPDYEPEATIVAAPVAVDNAIRRTRSLVVNVADVQQPLFPIPGRTYLPGDTLRVIDPPEIVDDPERVWSILYTRTEQGIVWEIQLGNESFASTGGGGGGAAGGGAGGGVDPAVAEPLRWLLDKEELNRQRPPAPPDRPPEPGCCPSCPAILTGVATSIATGFYSLDFIIDNDPDGTVSIDGLGNVTLKQFGYYTINLNFRASFSLTATGWVTWRLPITVSNNDAPQGTHYLTSAGVSGGFIHVNPVISMVGHVADDGEQFVAGFELNTPQFAGMVTLASLVLGNCDLIITRHGDGCARVEGSET